MQPLVCMGVKAQTNACDMHTIEAAETKKKNFFELSISMQILNFRLVSLSIGMCILFSW